MPLQNILTSEANARIARSGRKDLAFAPVGQIVGSMNQVRPVRDVMFQLVEEYIETVQGLAPGHRGLTVPNLPSWTAPEGVERVDRHAGVVPVAPAGRPS